VIASNIGICLGVRVRVRVRQWCDRRKPKMTCNRGIGARRWSQSTTVSPVSSLVVDLPVIASHVGHNLAFYIFYLGG
jgi:hypothetical protein